MKRAFEKNEKRDDDSSSDSDEERPPKRMVRVTPASPWPSRFAYLSFSAHT